MEESASHGCRKRLAVELWLHELRETTESECVCVLQSKSISAPPSTNLSEAPTPASNTTLTGFVQIVKQLQDTIEREIRHFASATAGESWLEAKTRGSNVRGSVQQLCDYMGGEDGSASPHKYRMGLLEEKCRQMVQVYTTSLASSVDSVLESLCEVIDLFIAHRINAFLSSISANMGSSQLQSAVSQIIALGLRGQQFCEIMIDLGAIEKLMEITEYLLKNKEQVGNDDTTLFDHLSVSSGQESTSIWSASDSAFNSPQRDQERGRNRGWWLEDDDENISELSPDVNSRRFCDFPLGGENEKQNGKNPGDNWLLPMHAIQNMDTPMESSIPITITPVTPPTVDGAKSGWRKFRPKPGTLDSYRKQLATSEEVTSKSNFLDQNRLNVLNLEADSRYRLRPGNISADQNFSKYQKKSQHFAKNIQNSPRIRLFRQNNNYLLGNGVTLEKSGEGKEMRDNFGPGFVKHDSRTSWNDLLLHRSILVSQTLRALATICCVPNCIDRLVNTGGIEGVTRALCDRSLSGRARAESAGVLAQVWSPRLLEAYNLSSQPFSIIDLSIDIIESLTALCRKAEEPEIFLLAAAALSTMTSSDPITCDYLIQYDTIEALLHAYNTRLARSVFSWDQIISVIYNVANIESYTTILLSIPHLLLVTVTLLQPFYHPSALPTLDEVDEEEPPEKLEPMLDVDSEAGRLSRDFSAVELAALASVQQKAAAVVTRLSRTSETAMRVVQMNCVPRLVELCSNAKSRNNSDAVLAASLTALRKLYSLCGPSLHASLRTHSVQQILASYPTQFFLQPTSTIESFI